MTTTATALRRATVRLARRLRAEQPPGGLPAGRLGVLGHLHRAGPSTPGELAAAQHVQPQSLTRTLAGLEADGLVTRARDAADARQYRITLTEAGRTAVAADMEQRDRWLAQCMEYELTHTERELLRLAAPLLDRLAESAFRAQDGTRAIGE